MKVVMSRFRSRSIRLLVVVLALTASRNNFPLLQWVSSSQPHARVTLSSTTGKSSRNSEQVIPSRRTLDGHRTQTLRIASSESEPQPAFGALLSETAGSESAVPASDHQSITIANPIAAVLLQVRIPQGSPFPPPL